MLREILILSFCAFSWGFPRNTEEKPRIVGGQETDISNYKYQVALLESNDQSCGASIIAPQFILTAAHCTEDVPAAALSVRVGSSYHMKGGEVYQVAEYWNHPNYNSKTDDLDVAVLKLKTPIKDGAKMAIKIAALNEELPDNQLATVTGWGVTEDGDRSDKLRKVDVPVITTKRCQTSYYTFITDNQFCAGFDEGGKDSCQGDSGGPLVYKGTQIGVVSTGYKCGDDYSPAIYTRISSKLVRDFIKSKANV